MAVIQQWEIEGGMNTFRTRCMLYMQEFPLWPAQPNTCKWGGGETLTSVLHGFYFQTGSVYKSGTHGFFFQFTSYDLSEKLE